MENIAGLEGIGKYDKLRYEQTISFLKKNVPPPCKVLDLGTPNRLSEVMQKNGYQVQNTLGEDFDFNPSFIKSYKADVVTSFEVFEHLLAPFNILREIEAPKLIATVPLKLWFADAYWNEKNDWDCHYHEFEKKQFDFLLRKTGWKVKDSALWTGPVGSMGLRPLLRKFTYRFYAVYCER